LENHLASQQWAGKDLLLMSSGNFGGINLKKLADQIMP
jgi:UDP-N-acetylmuramate: L-alanyl-gamma-D-glutamyl-meso-diaminopimelate ligase